MTRIKVTHFECIPCRNYKLIGMQMSPNMTNNVTTTGISVRPVTDVNATVTG